MADIDDKLNDVFNIEDSTNVVSVADKDITVVDKDKNSIDTITTKDDAIEDYQLSRNTLHQLISAGQEALEGALDVAKNTDSPRAYEVVSTTFKNLAECAEKLLALQKAAREMDGIQNNSNDNSSKPTNNTFFVGTTEELHALLDGKVRGEE